MSAELQAELKAYFNYDPETGVFTRRVSVGKWKAGSVAGCVDITRGYVQIRWKGRLWYGHRLAWLYMHGELPVGVDHKNGNKSLNSASELRAATQAENLQNIALPYHNTTGLLGVSVDSARGKFAARIGVNKKSKHLGRFDTAEAAHAAYVKAKRELHHFQPELRAA